MLPPIKLVTQPNKYMFKVLEDYVVDFEGVRIIVPAGFETDLATVPRWLFSMFPPDGEYKEAAVVHDYLLSTRRFKRKVCDRVFLGLMLMSGVSRSKAYTMYVAVRVFSKVKRYL